MQTIIIDSYICTYIFPSKISPNIYMYIYTYTTIIPAIITRPEKQFDNLNRKLQINDLLLFALIVGMQRKVLMYTCICIHIDRKIIRGRNGQV